MGLNHALLIRCHIRFGHKQRTKKLIPILDTSSSFNISRCKNDTLWCQYPFSLGKNSLQWTASFRDCQQMYHHIGYSRIGIDMLFPTIWHIDVRLLELIAKVLMELAGNTLGLGSFSALKYCLFKVLWSSRSLFIFSSCSQSGDWDSNFILFGLFFKHQSNGLRIETIFGKYHC